jgi:hypothetical protein
MNGTEEPFDYGRRVDTPPPPDSWQERYVQRQEAKASRRGPATPSGVLMLGALLGWGPWSAVIGAWLTFGNSGYTLSGSNSSASAVHSYCQAGGAVFQPGICGSIDAHYAWGVAFLVIGAIAFVGGIIGMFVAQQHNPKAWRQAGGPILAGCIFGLFAVVTVVIMAIVRGVHQGETGVMLSERDRLRALAASPQPPSQSRDSPAPADVPGRLAALTAMRAAGTLTDAEYAAKRADLIAEL